MMTLDEMAGIQGIGQTISNQNGRAAKGLRVAAHVGNGADNAAAQNMRAGNDIQGDGVRGKVYGKLLREG